jgi:hypothetical protein
MDIRSLSDKDIYNNKNLRKEADQYSAMPKTTEMHQNHQPTQ